MTRAQTVLAFDFGLKRIGIASGDTLTRHAAPRAPATVGRSGPDWRAIALAVQAHAPGLLIVGAPRNVDGTESALGGAARRFAAELERRFALPVELIDERYSSLEAGAALKARRASGAQRRRVQRADLDSAAAAVILGRWLSGEAGEALR
jgi:putative holliday junction resolvase